MLKAGGILLGFVLLVIYLTTGINAIVALLGLFALIVYSTENGFSANLVVIITVLLLLFANEGYRVLFPLKRQLLSIIPSILGITANLVWLAFAGLFYNGLYWIWGPNEKNFLIGLVLAILLAVVNIPSLVFHIALCSRRVRQKMLELDEKFKKNVHNPTIKAS